MHILITGSKGFTGKYLHDALIAAGHTVVGLKADLTDAEAVAQEIAEL